MQRSLCQILVFSSETQAEDLAESIKGEMKENLGPNRQYTRFVVWSRVMHPDWPRSHLAFRISASQMAGLVLPRWMKDAVHLAATRGPFFWRYLSAGSTNCKRRMILFRVLYDWHTLFRIMCRQSVFFCCSSSAASWEGAARRYAVQPNRQTSTAG